MNNRLVLSLLLGTTFLISCSDDDPVLDNTLPDLDIPSSYISDNYAANAATESAVIDELATLTSALNSAESDAQGGGRVAAVTYESNSTLAEVTQSNYKTLIDGWLEQLVAAANDDDRFQNPGLNGTPAAGEEGGLLGGNAEGKSKRLLDENGLELEQNIQKGSFGAALYNHAITVVNGIKSGAEGFTDPGAVDRLVAIHGTGVAFDPVDGVTAAATYSKRRSDIANGTGFFYDIQLALITAKAAMEAGEAYDEVRDEALDAYLDAWERSNYATVIYYCNATRVALAEAATLEGTARDDRWADALHAYAEGVGFAHGFKRLSVKQITDTEIDQILGLLLASEGQVPTSYEFLNDATLLENLTTIENQVKSIYGFSDEEAASFYVNN
ncbi:MAG: hypothetical protein HRT61_15260 [Ekhidna sp.]|nr:hypothetical protein [Ekhidna sp.]